MIGPSPIGGCADPSRENWSQASGASRAAQFRSYSDVEDKARSYLRAADAHKLAGDALVVEARGILNGLYEDGLIEPSHGQRAAGLMPGPRFSAIELPNGLAAHWPAGLYYDVTAIEREYFDMFFFSNLKSYKGAFHMSPDYAW